MYRFVIELVFVAGTVDGRWDANRIILSKDTTCKGHEE